MPYDFSPHRFIASDEARDPMGSEDNEHDAASDDAARSKIIFAEVFDSKDVSSPDYWTQKKAHRVNETCINHADLSSNCSSRSPKS